jgi:predicted MPP superfamily phosphohydrolase
LAERLKPRLDVEAYFRRSGRTLRKSRFRLWFNIHVKTALLRLAFRLAGIYRRGLRNALAVEVKRIEVRLPSLPKSFEGFRILHLSDLHIDGVAGLAERLEVILKDLHPDVCVLTGDYRFEIKGPCTDVYPRMQKVVSSIRAELGTFGTLGNHDAAEIAFRLEEMGVRMLVNESAEIRRGDESIWIAGLDDQFDYRCADLPLALEAVPRNSFVVLLAHDPQLFEAAEQRGVALYLCGHTHAGQIRLPLIGAVKKNALVPRRFVQGLWQYKAMQGYTSWGTGSSTVPVRYNCPPEIAILELKRQLHP